MKSALDDCLDGSLKVTETLLAKYMERVSQIELKQLHGDLTAAWASLMEKHFTGKVPVVNPAETAAFAGGFWGDNFITWVLNVSSPKDSDMVHAGVKRKRTAR